MFRALPLIFLSALLATGAFADEKADAQKQLDAARADVAELKKLLDQLQKEKSGVQKDLKRTETQMGDLEKQIDGLQGDVKENEKELQRLDQEKKKLQESRLEQQKLIAIQARAAYQGGQKEPLRLLLNQQQPEKFSRTLTYYDYLGQARVDQLTEFNETLRQLANVESDIASQKTQLLEKKDMLDSQRAELAAARKERQQALAKLNQDYNARDTKLKARQQEQADLARVLKTIEETLARQAREAEEARRLAKLEQERAKQQNSASSGTAKKATAPVSGPLVSGGGSSYGGPFSQAKGKLPWPVDGRLIARYGTPRGDDARSKWDGVLISASAGSQVRAVHGGRVVFADWLRGAGLLVILDHGNGYLSLYGHNQSLLKDAGDIVKAGDPIATVGTSGGQDTPALYFAIRQQGRPSDPAQWCRAQG